MSGKHVDPFAFPKRCACCGATHTAAAWARLPLVGYQAFPVEDGEASEAGGLLELRNCSAPCLTTLGIEVSP